ncbi:O-methyltransferase [Paenibacillus alba]|uniref:O-methyltransferase n=1 Tax=Paenibacillus alba TaxID=1197127 RepID=UPI001563B626|nr:O-methyltransferase [Paenibacillus alba]NQX68885.1 O-methyltransferase [Paenibacillus alba]
MNLEQIPLARQIDMVFRKIKEELSHVTSGTVFVHIRNNEIGKFGIKHLPFESKDGVLPATTVKGLTELQYQSFRQMAIESLKRKKSWTHGEILFDFTIRQNVVSASISFESNYNMANYARTM